MRKYSFQTGAEHCRPSDKEGDEAGESQERAGSQNRWWKFVFMGFFYKKFFVEGKNFRIKEDSPLPKTGFDLKI